MFRRRRPSVPLALAATALAAALTGVSLAGAGPAAAQSAESEIPPPPSMRGWDISWPQCPNGQPMPRGSVWEFTIIGLSGGIGWTPNPCLADQVRWARNSRTWISGYAVVTYPTASELERYGASGPYPTNNSADRLRNAGYAQANYNLDQMRRAGLNAKFLWVDVEPYPRRPWSSNQAANNAVIDGVLRGYADAGFPTGFYSYTNGWNEVTGGRRDTSRPTWVAAGRTNESVARQRCGQASFSGGPPVIGQWTDGTYDFNITCPGRHPRPYLRRAAPTGIEAHYAALGGAASVVGAPGTEERVTPDLSGVFAHFGFGSIYWTPPVGAREVHGAIRARWASLGWERSALRYPITDELPTPDGVGRFNHFQGGSIYWTSGTGAWEVRGAIRQRWQALAWERGPLRYPLTNERPTPDGVGRFNHFQGGSIYWTSGTGAHDVQGPLRQRWESTGWERGPLGYPVTGQRPTPDGVGRFNHFQNGSIYWTATTKAQEVRGAIRQRWASMGWERSALGYPITGEYDIPGGRASDFQGGRITWNRSTGATAVETAG